MINPDALAEAQKRLAQLEEEYEAAQLRSVALAGELLKAQNELWRLDRPRQPHSSAYTIDRCASCYHPLAFAANDWFLTCSCAYRTLHPQRHGELTAIKWNLIFYRSAEAGAGSWGWTLQYFTPSNEAPPEGSVRVKLWSEAQGWVFLYGASRRRDEMDPAARERAVTWRGTVPEGTPAMEFPATRAFVEPWYGAY